jgi:FKBP-type peptidyl-prolyl cis-trans isomerase FkpA
VLNLFDDSIDVSDGQGTVLKRILRQGDWRAGRPVEEDSVEIKWELRFLNGSVIGSSKPYEDVNDEPFTVRMGAQPRDMIEGWELALASMYPGEVSSVYLSSAVAFGEKGLADLVPPHTNIECTLELCSILPALTKRFKTVGEDESISQELVEKIQ